MNPRKPISVRLNLATKTRAFQKCSLARPVFCLTGMEFAKNALTRDAIPIPASQLNQPALSSIAERRGHVQKASKGGSTWRYWKTLALQLQSQLQRQPESPHQKATSHQATPNSNAQFLNVLPNALAFPSDLNYFQLGKNSPSSTHAALL